MAPAALLICIGKDAETGHPTEVFPTALAAGAAYDEMAMRVDGEEALLNFETRLQGCVGQVIHD